MLDGHPAAAYDWTIHRQVQEAAVGYAFDGEYRWHYPPPFLFAATLVALWRSGAPFELKAASIAVGTLLVTPTCSPTISWCSPSQRKDEGCVDKTPVGTARSGAR